MININPNNLFTGLIAGVAAGAIVVLAEGLTQLIYGDKFTVYIPIFKALASLVLLMIVIVVVLYKQDKNKPQKNKSPDKTNSVSWVDKVGLGHKKTIVLSKILRYMLYSKKETFSIEELKDEFKKNYYRVNYILFKLPFIELIKKQIGKSRNEVTGLKIKDCHELLQYTQSLATTIANENYQKTNTFLKVYSISFTAIIILVTILQFSVNTRLELVNNDIQKKVLELDQLSVKASLIISRESFGIDNENPNLIHFCVRNRGGIDSGKINSQVGGKGILGITNTYIGIKSKSYACVNQSFQKLGSKISETNLTITIGCVNCDEKIKEEFIIGLK